MGYLNEGMRPTNIPQSEPARADMVPNSAGGYAFGVDAWTRLRRFLILGTEGGTYYAGQRELTRENLDAARACLKEDGERVVREVVDVSDNGRAHKNDPALMILALASVEGDQSTKRLALAELPKVARIGTHLFQFVDFRKSLGGGWGRSASRAIKRWYLDREVEQLAYQMAKYQQREGWSHRDLLRLAHPSPTRGGPRDAVFRWTMRQHGVEQLPDALPPLLEAVNELHAEGTDATRAANLIGEYRLPREVVPSDLLREVSIWGALLQHMPMHATIRNLGNMTRIGLLAPLSRAVQTVCDRLVDAEQVRKARVHPIQVLAAMVTYAQGHGARGRGEWVPVPAVIDALDIAFYHSFDNVEPTGKRILLALDVSGSMRHELSGVPGLTCRSASAALAMVTMRTEPLGSWHTTAFSDGNQTNRPGWGIRDKAMCPLDIGPRMRLDDVLRQVDGLRFGGTDCALPMLYATKNKLEVDAFIIYTDSETWAGTPHPFAALKDYRQRTGIPARLVVVGMTSNGFSIADPTDPGMLDVVGFDTGTPNLISEFINERV